jgi:hypothetical protein
MSGGGTPSSVFGSLFQRGSPQAAHFAPTEREREREKEREREVREREARSAPQGSSSAPPVETAPSPGQFFAKMFKPIARRREAAAQQQSRDVDSVFSEADAAEPATLFGVRSSEDGSGAGGDAGGDDPGGVFLDSPSPAALSPFGGEEGRRRRRSSTGREGSPQPPVAAVLPFFCVLDNSPVPKTYWLPVVEESAAAAAAEAAPGGHGGQEEEGAQGDEKASNLASFLRENHVAPPVLAKCARCHKRVPMEQADRHSLKCKETLPPPLPVEGEEGAGNGDGERMFGKVWADALRIVRGAGAQQGKGLGEDGSGSKAAQHPPRTPLRMLEDAIWSQYAAEYQYRDLNQESNGSWAAKHLLRAEGIPSEVRAGKKCLFLRGFFLRFFFFLPFVPHPIFQKCAIVRGLT